MKKGLSRYAGYIEDNVMEVLKDQAKKEERALVFMINRRNKKLLPRNTRLE